MTRNESARIWLLKALALACLALWIAEAVALSKLPGQVFPGFRYEAPLDISPINHPTWNGPRTGKLRDYDRILAVDQSTVSTPAELDRIVASKPPGTPLTYTLWRDGETLHVTVETQRMSLGSWFQSFMSILVPALLYLLVGMLAFWVRPEHRAAQVHLLVTCAVAAFGVCANDIDAARLFLPLFPFAIPLLGSAFLHLAVVFPDARAARRPQDPEIPARVGTLKRLAPYLPYLPLLLLSVPWAFVFRAEGHVVDPARWDLHKTFYDLTNAWLGVGFLGLIGALGWKAWRSPTDLLRKQARIALWGALGAFLPITLLYLVPYFLKADTIGPLGQAVYFSYVASVLFPLSIAYAILRAQLFDIRVVIKRTVTYTVVTGALLGVYFLLGATVRGWADILFDVKAGTGPLESLIATGVVAAAFNPLATWTRAQVDRFFDRGQYDIGEVLERYAGLSDETMDPRTQFDIYMDIADQTVAPQHISIFVRDPASGMLTFRAARRIDIPPTYAVSPDKGELIELRKADKTGLLAHRARTAPLVAGRHAWGFALYIPLMWQGEVIGRINFGLKRSDQIYSERDRQLLTSMAHRLADKLRIADMLQVAVAKARLDQELATAQAIHSAMLPSKDPQVPGLDVASTSTAAVEFGGDYYDLVPLDGGRLAVAIGDVAGKGVQAAMVMAMTKAAFSTLVKADPSVEKVMSGLNQMICDTIPDRTYRKTTFCYAILDPAAGTLTYACAGHPPPLRFRQDRTCEAVPAPGAFPFGTSRRSRYEPQTISVGPGDGLVFYTDGVTEAAAPDGRTFYDVVRDENGQEVERDELVDVVGRHTAQAAERIKDAILRRLREFTAKADVTDDVTMVIVKIGTGQS